MYLERCTQGQYYPFCPRRKSEITKIPVSYDEKQLDRLRSLERYAAELHENDTTDDIPAIHF